MRYGSRNGERGVRVIAIVVFVLLAESALEASVLPADDIVELETRVAVDSVTVGERFEVRYVATFPDSLTMLPVESFDAGTCRLFSLIWSDSRVDKKRVKEARLTAVTVDLDEAVLPAATFLFLTDSGDTLSALSENVSLAVRAITDEQAEARPLKPQWQAPRSYVWLYILIGSLLALGFVAWLWRRRKRTIVVAPPAPQLPADYLAMRELDRIESLMLIEDSKFKSHYTLVVDTVRQYLERRYAVQAMDRTSLELIDDLDDVGVRIDSLSALLEEADLVKFAKFEPDADRASRTLDSARDIVARTAPKPMVAGE